MVFRFLRNTLYSINITIKSLIGMVLGPILERYYLSSGSIREEIIWDDDTKLECPKNIKKNTFYRYWRDNNGVCKILDDNYIPHKVSRDGFISLHEYIYKKYGIKVSIHYSVNMEENKDTYVNMNDLTYKVLYSYYSFENKDIKLLLYNDDTFAQECYVSIKDVTNTKMSRNNIINSILDEI